MPLSTSSSSSASSSRRPLFGSRTATGGGCGVQRVKRRLRRRRQLHDVGLVRKRFIVIINRGRRRRFRRSGHSRTLSRQHDRIGGWMGMLCRASASVLLLLLRRRSWRLHQQRRGWLGPMLMGLMLMLSRPLRRQRTLRIARGVRHLTSSPRPRPPRRRRRRRSGGGGRGRKRSDDSGGVIQMLILLSLLLLLPAGRRRQRQFGFDERRRGHSPGKRGSCGRGKTHRADGGRAAYAGRDATATARDAGGRRGVERMPLLVGIVRRHRGQTL